MAVASSLFYLEFVSCSYCCLLFLILLYYFHKFFIRRWKKIYHKRLYNFVVCVDLCSLFFIGYISPLRILSLSKVIEIPRAWHDWIVIYPAIVCQYILISVAICRYWLLHYHITWTYHLKHLEILSKINPNAKKVSWYLTKKTKFGNMQFCVKITLLVIVLCSIVSCVQYYAFSGDSMLAWIWYIWNAFILMIATFGIFLIRTHTLPFFDFFLIRQEISISMFCAFITIFGFVVTSITKSVIPNSIIPSIIGFSCSASIYFTLALTMTWFVLQYAAEARPRTSTHGRSDSLLFVDASLAVDDTPASNTANATLEMTENSKSSANEKTAPKKEKPQLFVLGIPMIVYSKINSPRLHFDGRIKSETDIADALDGDVSLFNEVTLYNVLADECGLHSFLLHSYKEYSIENILAVIEFSQFQTFYGSEKKQRTTRTIKLLQQRSRSLQDQSTNNSIDFANAQHSKGVSVDTTSVKVSENSETAKSKANETTITMMTLTSPDQMVDEVRQKRKGSLFDRITRPRMQTIDDVFALQMKNHTFVLPQNLVHSSIVYDRTLNIKQKVVRLADKYIKRKSEYELNLGNDNRNRILRTVENMDIAKEDELKAIFNNTIYAVIALMHDSYLRFQQTNSYEEIRRGIKARQISTK